MDENGVVAVEVAAHKTTPMKPQNDRRFGFAIRAIKADGYGVGRIKDDVLDNDAIGRGAWLHIAKITEARKIIGDIEGRQALKPFGQFVIKIIG